MAALIFIGEALVVAVCVKIFDMGEAPTFCAVIAVWCIVCAFASYFNNKSNNTTHKPRQNQKQQESDCLHCPCCFGINTLMDDDGNCTCFDCQTCWKEEI